MDEWRIVDNMGEGATIGGNEVLIVIDMQNDFCPGGALAVPQGDEIVSIVNRLAARFRHVVLTQDWHPPGHFSFASSHAGKKPFNIIATSYGSQVLWPDHCVQGAQGATFHAALDIPILRWCCEKAWKLRSILFGILRKRWQDTDRAGWLFARTRLQPRVRGRARARFLRTLFGQTPSARALRFLWSRTPAAALTSTARSRRPGQVWPVSA